MLTGGFATSTTGATTNMISGSRGTADGINNLREKNMRQSLELLVSCRASTIIRMISGVDRSRTARTSTGWRTLLAPICQKVTTTRRKLKSPSEGNCYLSSNVLYISTFSQSTSISKMPNDELQGEEENS